MKCPNCSSELRKQIYRGIEVDRCDNCKGIWLDIEELDQLEDKAFDADRFKGSLMISSEPTDHLCPHCGSPLHEFQYRVHSLQLEYCENQHGFWLDAGEEKRVLQLMKEREKALRRKFKAEDEWGRTLQQFRSKSFWSKLTDLFR